MQSNSSSIPQDRRGGNSGKVLKLYIIHSKFENNQTTHRRYPLFSAPVPNRPDSQNLRPRGRQHGREVRSTVRRTLHRTIRNGGDLPITHIVRRMTRALNRFRNPLGNTRRSTQNERSAFISTLRESFMTILNHVDLNQCHSHGTRVNLENSERQPTSNVTMSQQRRNEVPIVTRNENQVQNVNHIHNDNINVVPNENRLENQGNISAMETRNIENEENSREGAIGGSVNGLDDMRNILNQISSLSVSTSDEHFERILGQINNGFSRLGIR